MGNVVGLRDGKGSNDNPSSRVQYAGKPYNVADSHDHAGACDDVASNDYVASDEHAYSCDDADSHDHAGSNGYVASDDHAGHLADNNGAPELWRRRILTRLGGCPTTASGGLATPPTRPRPQERRR